jgi:uncharacterized protein with HEPN domain
MLEATRKIASYTADLSKAAFLEDEKTFDVVLSIQVMGQRPYQELKARGSTFLVNVEQEGLAV